MGQIIRSGAQWIGSQKKREKYNKFEQCVKDTRCGFCKTDEKFETKVQEFL